MAGHSKWANIKFRKAAQDNKRGKLFTKLIREITVAAKMGGGDPDANPRLRAAIDKALGQNMTRDTIERAVKRGVGAGDTENYENVRYEGYGPGGVAVMIDCLTDNRKRTVSEVRHALTKHGGNLGTDGSVSYLFNQKGQIILSPGVDEDTVVEIALESGAEDVNSQEDGSIEVLAEPKDFISVKEALAAANIEWHFAEVLQLAETQVDLDIEQSKTNLKMIDMLEDLDDVQSVSTNASFDAGAYES